MLTLKRNIFKTLGLLFMLSRESYIFALASQYVKVSESKLEAGIGNLSVNGHEAQSDTETVSSQVSLPKRIRVTSLRTFRKSWIARIQIKPQDLTRYTSGFYKN
jgi:hypothetical protein